MQFLIGYVFPDPPGPRPFMGLWQLSRITDAHTDKITLSYTTPETFGIETNGRADFAFIGFGAPFIREKIRGKKEVVITPRL